MSSRPRLLRTFDEVVNELGGTHAVAKLVEQNSAAVCNWRRRRQRFPTKFFLIMKRKLARRGAKAPHELWGFYEKKKA